MKRIYEKILLKNTFKGIIQKNIYEINYLKEYIKKII